MLYIVGTEELADAITRAIAQNEIDENEIEILETCSYLFGWFEQPSLTKQINGLVRCAEVAFREGETPKSFLDRIEREIKSLEAMACFSPIIKREVVRQIQDKASHKIAKYKY